MSSLDPYRAANLARWDESVAIHVASEFYGVDRFLAGESTLLPLDREEVDDVRGQSLLHLQCHFGLDTLSWARAGAAAVGVDFSPAAISTARDLAERAGISAEFVESELYAAPQALADRLASFDIVYVNLGAICWLPDIRGWAQVCARFLKPGGQLFVRDVHPLTNTIDDEAPAGELRIAFPAFETEEPLQWCGDADYADTSAQMVNQTSYEWNHSLGEIVTAVIDAGCHIDFLHEQEYTVYRALPWLVEGPRGIFRLPDLDGLPDRRLPLMFTLSAHKT